MSKWKIKSKLFVAVFVVFACIFCTTFLWHVLKSFKVKIFANEMKACDVIALL